MAKSDIFLGKVKANRRRMSKIIADYDLADKKREESALKPKSEDSIIRSSIHNDIKESLSTNKSKLEILAFLNNKYPDTYLNKYFGQWIDYHVEKRDYTIKENEIEF